MRDLRPANAGRADPYRPRYHFAPRRGWMNDPVGLVFLDGEWHLFFQHNPQAPVWGNIAWGHAVSPDLVHWRELPVAIRPSARLGMAFSGSAVVDRADASGLGAGRACLVAVFTHAGGADGAQKQSLAASYDGGRSFVEHTGNPVLPNPGLADFRDPKVLWHEATRRFVMLLAAGDRAHVYTSPDLRAWSKRSEVGPFPGFGGTWECPELFPLALERREKWVFKLDRNLGLAKPGNEARYLVGTFDGERFAPETPPPGRRVDFGPDFYAAQSWSEAPGGRRIWIAWRDSWQYALATPTGGWRGSMCLPREVALVDDGEGPRLVQQPVAELRALREAPAIATRERVDLAPGVCALDGIDGDALEISVVVRPGSARCAGLAVRRGDGEETRIGYDRERAAVFVDRARSGDVAFAPGFAARFEAPLPLRAEGMRLQIFVDRSSVEVFADGGRAAQSANVYPRPDSVGVSAFAEGGRGELRDLEVYRLEDAFRA